MKIKFQIIYLLSIVLAGAPNTLLLASEPIGSAVSVSGKVLMRNESAATAQMVFLKVGDKIQVGSIINTGSNGAVKLLMTDKTIVDLGPSSLFKVNEYQLKKGSDRSVDVSVEYGKVRASVNQHLTNDKGKFTIRTKAATMGVRGTEFVVSAPMATQGGQPAASEQTQLTVIKGRVDVATASAPNAAPTAVSAGMQFFKPAEGQVQIAKLDTQQIQQVKQEAFQKDMTFIQAVSIDANSARESAANQNTPNNSTGSNSDSTGQANTSDQTAEKTEAKGDSASASTPASTGSQTLAAIAANVQIQTQAAANNPPISNMQFPGVFGPPGTQPPAPQVLQGQPVNLNVKFNP
jgi:hypothetical protein